ncbi:MAG: hypothetical protein EU517_01340, partial [Promethearchaeota archaeon]
ITEDYDSYNWHDGFIDCRAFFWNEICDNYIEAIKYRFYSENPTLRKNALKVALILFYKILICFGFIMPFITEEIYAILFKRFVKKESIHLETWPSQFTGISKASAKSGEIAIEIIKILRNIKSKLRLPLNQEVSKVIITSSNKKDVKMIRNLEMDIKNTIRIVELNIIVESKLEKSNFFPAAEEKINSIRGKLYFFK